ncbi:hypothetical protein [Corallococcus exercitus]|uniref:hypothetical protein n=1 Tax=Corallococcus exercitus TaxID=2316736 RepID=UPI0035D50B49
MTGLQNPSAYHIGTQAILPATPEQLKACSITKQDLDILLEGSGAGLHRSHRDLTLGVFTSAFTGAIGLITALPDEITKTSKTTLTFLLLLSATTIASGFIAIIKHYQAQREEGRASFQNCKKRLERMLDGPPV